jgi:predicted Zn-dependent protease
MGALTWAEDAIAKGKLDGDPAAIAISEQRVRYGVPRGTKVVAPEHEGDLVAAVKQAITLSGANKRADAEKLMAAIDKQWPNAPGLYAARCDLAVRANQLDAARAACDRALALDADESWALYLSGVIALKDTSESGAKRGIDRLKRAIAVDPGLGQAWRTLAKAYARVKDKAALEQLGTDYAAKFGQALPP